MGFFDNLDKGIETFDKVSSDYHRVKSTVDNIRYGRDRIKSEELQRMKIETEKLNKKVMIWFIATIVICLAMLIATIVMCVKGNDIVLQWVGLR